MRAFDQIGRDSRLVGEESAVGVRIKGGLEGRVKKRNRQKLKMPRNWDEKKNFLPNGG